MTDIETTVENARAQYHYPPIREALLPSEADDLQMRLADRLYRHAHRNALEVIADLGAVFDAEDAEPAIEALGRLLVHASLLAGCERMAIAPIIALGRELTRDSQVGNELPLTPAAALAAAVLDHRHDAVAIVCALAGAIAKAIDDCEIVHELKIDPLELFKIAAREMLEGRPITVVTAPAVQPTQPDKAAQRALAWTELRKASEAVVADELAQVTSDAPVDLTSKPPTQCPMCGALGAADPADPHLEGAMIEQIEQRMAERSSSAHRVLTVTGADLDAAALLAGPPTLARRILPDPGNPGGQGPFGDNPWPPDHRWETDAEFRKRIKATWDPVGGRPVNPVSVAAAAMAGSPFADIDTTVAHGPIRPPTCSVCHVPMSPRPDMQWAWHCPKHP